MNKGTLLLFLFLASCTAPFTCTGLASTAAVAEPAIRVPIVLAVSPIFLLAVVVAFFLVLALAVKVLKAKGGDASPKKLSGAYTLRPSVLSPAERSFLGVLNNALPEGVEWIAKIRLGDVVTARKGLSPSERTSAINRVNQKHVDFLLVQGSDFVPLAGIELDDRSHEKDDRKARDAFVDEVFQSCKLPLLHVRAQATYNVAELRATISKALTR